MKRGRDTLTGGTRDVNPQAVNISTAESAANTFTQTSINLPVLRGGTTGRLYQVIELLKILSVVPVQH